jgi:glycosyltransferase involved in cell wall biosynthesis
MPPAVIVFAARPGDRARAGRTLRSLRRRGLDPIDATAAPPAEVAAALSSGAAWFVRAGAWPIAAPAFPPPSATGQPLVAFGAVRAHDGEVEPPDATAWRELLARTGGDLGRLGAAPPIASVYCEAAPARSVGERLAAGKPLAEALLAAVAPAAVRLVRYAPLDVHDDERLRVVLAITSLQRGGAERMVIDLAAELRAHGVRPLVATTHAPSREPYPAPAPSVDLAPTSPRREARIAALAEVALDDAADLVHAHLLSGDDLARLAAAGLPVAVTVHNTREGWPEGLASLPAEHARLLVACSLAAEADLREARIPVAARTVWNGIDVARHRPSPARRRAGEEVRRDLRLAPTDLVLLAVANPRPQKRLHLLPEVLAEARVELFRRGIRREARLVIAGDAEPRTEPAASSMKALREAVTRLALADHVRFAGLVTDTVPVLAAADVLVSVSAHEGLSLAHLEALAMGLPLAATDAGGTREIAPGHPAVTVLPRDAAPVQVAEAAVRLALERPAGGTAVVEADFSRTRMAARYASLYPRVAAASRRVSRAGLVLVTNNLSTGGAQSSARRLLAALAAEGTPVRAALLQEQPQYPTPGRRALEAAGVPVLALPPPEDLDPPRAVARLLEWIDEAAPRAVLFWNALAEHKIRLADALIDVPVFDVSPGEMFFASLDRHLRVARPALPYRDARAYGSRLAGVIVKYGVEAARAAETLGAPVHVIPNGVPIPARAPRRPREGRVVFGTACRLAPQKKLEALLDAFRRAHADLGPYVLRVAGGPERGSEAYAEALRERARGLDVEWCGETADAGAFLAGLDVFAMISEPAGCPNASLEAMAAGLPVIATDAGGASEQVVDGVTGRLVPRDDEARLAEALVDLARHEALAARLGDAGRARAEALFDVRRMVADYRRVCLPHA